MAHTRSSCHWNSAPWRMDYLKVPHSLSGKSFVSLSHIRNIRQTYWASPSCLAQSHESCLGSITPKKSLNMWQLADGYFWTLNVCYMGCLRWYWSWRLLSSQWHPLMSLESSVSCSNCPLPAEPSKAYRYIEMRYIPCLWKVSMDPACFQADRAGWYRSCA